MRYKDIAVIGMSGRFASANNLEEYREILKGKQSVISEPDKERLDLMKYSHSAEYMKCGYMHDIDKFDNEFFDITNREARLMSPEQRISLEMVAETILDAGYSLESFSGSNCGVFTSSGESDYNRFVEKQSSSSIIGSQSFMLSGRIGYHFNLQGENIAVNSGCSSALMAIHYACEKLTLGEIDSAIVGGIILYVDVPKAKDNMYDTLGIMSDDYTIRSFGEGANGTVCGEGGGYVLLKSLEQAEKDGDNIYGVIVSGASNGDGALCTSVSMPSVEQQGKVVLKAWENTDVENITEIEAHGIGAPVGDAVEIQGLAEVLKQKGLEKKDIKLSTAKANVGHMFSQSGMASIIKVMLGYSHNETYPIACLDKLNPLIKFDETALAPQREVYHWKESEKRMTGISSFGLSGCNAHVVVKNYVDEADKKLPAPLLKISAKTETAFNAMKKSIVDSLGDSYEKIGNLVYTLNTGRDDYEYRSVVAADNLTDLKNGLENAKPIKAESEKTKVFFVIKTEDGGVEEMQPGEVLPSFKYESVTGNADIDRKLAMYRSILDLGIKSNTLLVDKIFATAVKLRDGKITKDEYETAVRDIEVTAGYEKFIAQVRSKNKGNRIVIIDFTKSEGMAELENEENIDIFYVHKNEEIERLIKYWYEKGNKVDWDNYYGKNSGYRKVSAPGYPFDRKHFWVEIKEPAQVVEVKNSSAQVSNPTPVVEAEGRVLPEKKIFVLKSDDREDVDIKAYPYADAEFRKVFEPLTGDIDTDYKLAMYRMVAEKNIKPDVILADKCGRNVISYVKGRISKERLNDAALSERDRDLGKAVSLIEDYAKDYAVTVFDFGSGELKKLIQNQNVRVVSLDKDGELKNYLVNPELILKAARALVASPIEIVTPVQLESESPASVVSVSAAKSPEILEAEGFLEQTWLKAFNLDGNIGHDEDFFSLGGNSLIMQSMSDEINSHFNKKFDIFEIYDYETIEKLAVKILED